MPAHRTSRDTRRRSTGPQKRNATSTFTGPPSEPPLEAVELVVVLLLVLVLSAATLAFLWWAS